MKIPNINKSNMEIDLINELCAALPKREMPPTWLLVDQDIYLTLQSRVSPFLDEDYINFRGWRVIGRGNVCEVG